MELMTIKDGINLVDKYKEIYKEEYKDIQLVHGRSIIKNLNGENMTLGLLESHLELYRDGEDIQSSTITIGRMIILKYYELLDSNTLNLHSPNYWLKI